MAGLRLGRSLRPDVLSTLPTVREMSVRAQTWAWEQKAGPDKLLLIALADHASEDGRCWPGQERLAAKTEKKVRAVRDGLKRLEAGGLIERTPRYRDGHRITDLYRLPIAADFAAMNEFIPADVDTSYRQPTAGEPSEEPSEEKTVSADREAEDRLLMFWVEATGRNGKTRLTQRRRLKVRARRKEFEDEEIRRAIVNCAASRWHVENGHTDIELICRSTEKLERFRDMDGGEGEAEAWAKLLS